MDGSGVICVALTWGPIAAPLHVWETELMGCLQRLMGQLSEGRGWVP